LAGIVIGGVIFPWARLPDGMFGFLDGGWGTLFWILFVIVGYILAVIYVRIACMATSSRTKWVLLNADVWRGFISFWFLFGGLWSGAPIIYAVVVLIIIEILEWLFHSWGDVWSERPEAKVWDFVFAVFFFTVGTILRQYVLSTSVMMGYAHYMYAAA